MTFPVIDVCAAVVFSDDGRLLLSTRPAASHLAGKWEFPGGKMLPGESHDACITRELAEELGLAVRKTNLLLSHEHEYPEKKIRLHFVKCEVQPDCQPKALEGQQFAWFKAAEAGRKSNLAPADQTMLEKLRQIKDWQATEVASELQIHDRDGCRQLQQWLWPAGQGDAGAAAMSGGQLPSWLRVPRSGGRERLEMRSMLRNSNLHTVCESAKCPNLCDCWQRRTATFMLLGENCTRNCKFCAVTAGRPTAPDPEEPEKIALGVEQLGLRFAVLTCVTRDDLPDGGAHHLAETVRAIRRRCPDTLVELLCSDFNGDLAQVDVVLESQPAVFGHNLETVSRLTPLIRSHADYARSLAVLAYAAKHAQGETAIKSGLMLGLGEEEDEVREALLALRQAGVSMVTIGQYLQPTRDHWPVARMITPDEFARWQQVAEQEMGFARAVCGALVRSSYMAEEAFQAARKM